jgi:hypothetical protein
MTIIESALRLHRVMVWKIPEFGRIISFAAIFFSIRTFSTMKANKLVFFIKGRIRSITEGWSEIIATLFFELKSVRQKNYHVNLACLSNGSGANTERGFLIYV